jgi:hypothetical protein
MVDDSKGILAFDVEKRKWREDGICPLPDISVRFAIAQLLKCNGRVYLFSEQEAGRNVTHCIHRLDLYREGDGFTWNRAIAPAPTMVVCQFSLAKAANSTV